MKLQILCTNLSSGNILDTHPVKLKYLWILKLLVGFYTFNLPDFKIFVGDPPHLVHYTLLFFVFYLKTSNRYNYIIQLSYYDNILIVPKTWTYKYRKCLDLCSRTINTYLGTPEHPWCQHKSWQDNRHWAQCILGSYNYLNYPRNPNWNIY